MSSMRSRISDFVRSLQEEIVLALESLDPEGPKFVRDSWTRPEGGSGLSCVLQGTDKPRDNLSSAAPPFAPLEKAGVNISIINGRLPPAAIAHMRADHAGLPIDTKNIPPAGLPFFVAGLSLVIHPRSPHAPTVHANWRYFEIDEADVDPSDESTDRTPLAWWFGGGSDLTPSYLYPEDCVHFHKTIQDACTPFGKDLYPAMKAWCDEYFYIPHRKEARGIGGIFFDDMSSHNTHRIDIHADPSPRPRSAEECFAFIQSLGKSFVPGYLPIMHRRAFTPWTEEERQWQLIRRGRYVEFNLVVDRGTKFGLQTPSARIESILMTLPETARWEYMSEVGAQSGSREAQMLEVLATPRNWV
ncbi:coproporphyrinogen III oxidase [Rhizoctonia solani]|uniref:coproporphyrinogen oxidase n=1 Tax=Rhizoctonia solani TaxID=456999 RepID=A0A8H8NZR2_9AGAM|nr:coproporphyrinogen III oxidase [Rhizoctonia solani]QRW22430.1 coproporphyrinogen III oxidase [Rhizoctonia solani]